VIGLPMDGDRRRAHRAVPQHHVACIAQVPTEQRSLHFSVGRSGLSRRRNDENCVFSPRAAFRAQSFLKDTLARYLPSDW
jgi:hypothetical protein